MKISDLRPLVEPDLTRKGLKWNNVAYVEFFPQYYEVTCWIRGFDGNLMYNPLEDDAYKTTVRFKYKELDNGVVEDQSVPESPSAEASGGCKHTVCYYCGKDRASRNGNPSGSAGEGPGDRREAEASAEAPREEAEAPSGRDTGDTPCGPGSSFCNAIGACYNHR